MEARIKYRDYKKFKKSIGYHHYDDDTKEVVAYITNFKRYVIEYDGLEWEFYTAENYSNAFPIWKCEKIVENAVMSPYKSIILISNGDEFHEKEDFLFNRFQYNLSKSMEKWKCLKLIEDISQERFFDVLTNSKLF